MSDSQIEYVVINPISGHKINYVFHYKDWKDEQAFFHKKEHEANCLRLADILKILPHEYPSRMDESDYSRRVSPYQ